MNEQPWRAVFKCIRPCFFSHWFFLHLHIICVVCRRSESSWESATSSVRGHTVYSAATVWVIIVSLEINVTKARKHHSGGKIYLKDIASNASYDQPPFCFQIAGLHSNQLFSVFYLHTESEFTFIINIMYFLLFCFLPTSILNTKLYLYILRLIG